MTAIVRSITSRVTTVIIRSINKSFPAWELNIINAAMVPGPEIMGIASGNIDKSSFPKSSGIILVRDGLAKIISIEIMNNKIPPDIKNASGETPRYNNIYLPKKIKKTDTRTAVIIALKIILLRSLESALVIYTANTGINPKGSTAMNKVKNIDIIKDICIAF